MGRFNCWLACPLGSTNIGIWGEANTVSFRQVGAILGISLAVSACQSTTASVQNKEDMLAAAGFVLQPANTPERLAALKSLPPHRFVQQTKNNTVIYVYGDPTICRCVYFGTQQAYGTYRSMVFQQKIANEQQMTAFMQQQAAFDFGPWGPGFWY